MANRALIAIQIIMTLFTHDNFLKFILQFNKHSKVEDRFMYIAGKSMFEFKLIYSTSFSSVFLRLWDFCFWDDG